MKIINLTQGQVTLVDDKDFDWLNQWKWWALKNKDNTFYAVKHGSKINGKYVAIRMHRLILGLTDPKVLGDHEDHNGLNNQRSNLRIASHTENTRNRSSLKNSSSKYLGVSWIEARSKWYASIQINNKTISLGRFIIEEDAAKAYDIAAVTHYKEFANLNFK